MEEDPTTPRSRIYALASILQRYQTRIPASLTSLLTIPRKYTSGEIVRFIDDVSEEHYAIIRGQRWLYELREDSSGFYVPRPDPYDIIDWDLDDPVNGLYKVARWGSQARIFRPILGLMSTTFSQDQWWKSPFHKGTFLLSELSIRRMTRMLTAPTAPPKCEHNWLYRVSRYLLLSDNLPWRDIWASTGCFLLSPSAEYSWFRYLHRSLYVLSQQSADATTCRLCGLRPERLLHLPFCSATRPIRSLVNRFIKAFGYEGRVINPNPLLSLGFNLDAKERVWKDAVVQSILRLYWRIVYRHMVRLLLDSTPFNARNAQRDLCRAFMEAILNYQSARRSFYIYVKSRHG